MKWWEWGIVALIAFYVLGKKNQSDPSHPVGATMNYAPPVGNSPVGVDSSAITDASSLVAGEGSGSTSPVSVPRVNTKLPTNQSGGLIHPIVALPVTLQY